MFHVGKPTTQADFEAYYDLRWRVLRQPWGQPRLSERDSLDATADHVLVHDQAERLLGVGRLHRNGPTEAQIRYMAVEEGCRGIGVGRVLLQQLERIACEHQADKVVLNARENAVGFYEHLGYAIVAPGDTKFGMIKHFLMRKHLEQ